MYILNGHKKTFPPIPRTPHASSVPHHSPQMWSRLRPPLYASFCLPLFPLQRKKSFSFSLFYQHPLPYLPLPTADRGTQTTTLSSQTLIVCACVCIFFPPWHEEGNQVSVCSLCLWMCSPEPSESFCSTEKVEVAEFSCEKLLELGKFGFWIHKTLATE